jgi:epoxyqueuosine reductase
MKAVLRRRARELGFDDCRFTSAAPPDSTTHFQSWLEHQRHGEMAYLARNASKRLDPQKVLPGAKTILTLATSYAQASDQPSNIPHSALRTARSVDLPSGTPHSALRTPHSGVVARYACYDDYHNVLGERLKQLTGLLSELSGTGARSLWYVDTGPLLERDLAQRSGLGFIGKHTNLISRRLGNWIFLSEILTTVELEPDEPETNRCGSCARCIAACPTNAITAPFQLDARRCISYLTIELKGSIPIEFRPAIGNRIYGCDDCLAVCPWNRFAQQGRLMQAHVRPDLAASDLLELLALDDAGFKHRFAQTPLIRAKRRGLRRNVCVALGNVGDASGLPALEKAAADPEPLVAEHARWAIEQICGRVNRSSEL